MRTSLAIFLAAACLFAADLPRRAPGFALMDNKMKVHDLYDFRGKPVVLEFMQTTCPHCAAFTSVLQGVQEKFGDRVHIVAIVNSPDNFDTVRQYIEGHKITYPILFDSGQAAYSYLLTQRFDLPQVFLIDANGIIQQHYEYGPLTRDIFEGKGLAKEIERMLAPRARGKKK
jgi:peroxiredoxin